MDFLDADKRVRPFINPHRLVATEAQFKLLIRNNKP